MLIRFEIILKAKPSLALKTEHDAALMAAGTVLPEEDALPGAKAEAAVGKRDHLGGAGKRHLDVAWHIVGAFVGVGKVGIVFRHQTVDETLEVAARGGVGVFHNDEAAARVAAKHGHGALVEAGLEERLFNQVGKLSRRFTWRCHGDFFGKDGHWGI